MRFVECVNDGLKPMRLPVILLRRRALDRADLIIVPLLVPRKQLMKETEIRFTLKRIDRCRLYVPPRTSYCRVSSNILQRGE